MSSWRSTNSVVISEITADAGCDPEREAEAWVSASACGVPDSSRFVVCVVATVVRMREPERAADLLASC